MSQDLSLEHVVELFERDLPGDRVMAVGIHGNCAVVLSEREYHPFTDAPYQTHLVGERSVESGVYDLDLVGGWDSFNWRHEQHLRRRMAELEFAVG